MLKIVWILFQFIAEECVWPWGDWCAWDTWVQIGGQGGGHDDWEKIGV